MGVISNPTIFDRAIRQSDNYDGKIGERHTQGKSTLEIYDDLTVIDIQEAADIFMPVYKKTGGLDGHVSVEINPQLASKAAETIEEVKRLWRKVDRPNVLYEVPATNTGFDAVEELLASGININVILIFSERQYVRAAEAFLKGIQRLSKMRNDLSGICSVASVFVSRIDMVVDKLLDRRIEQATNQLAKRKLQDLKGKAAVENARIIFKRYSEFFSENEFQTLKKKGAMVQRLLWSCTTVENPEYGDIKYASELIGKGTINTMTENTFETFLDHGMVEEALTTNLQRARIFFDNLKKAGVDIGEVYTQLLRDGIASFERSFDSVLQSIEDKINSSFATSNAPHK